MSFLQVSETILLILIIVFLSFLFKNYLSEGQRGLEELKKGKLK